MGSLAAENEDSEREIHVLVTGFGAFGENKINPSYLIASSLPTRYSVPHLPSIVIHSHPTPITVAYSRVREIIPQLLFNDPKYISHDGETISPERMHVSTKPVKQRPNYDIVLNIGLAPGRKFYTLETLAHRDGYNRKDVEGKTLVNDTFWQDEYNAPEILLTSSDTEDVWRRWKSGLMSEDVRPSNNAGHYLCDFTYYACMLEYWRRNPKGQRPCMFLHVPSGDSERDIIRGRKVALGLIAALVGSQMMEGKRDVETGITIDEKAWDDAADDECSWD